MTGENANMIAPLVVLGAAWAIVEFGLSAYDIFEAGATVLDDNASGTEKAIAVGGVIVGALLPGGGYGTGGKAIWTAGKAGSNVKNALRHWNDHKLDFPEYNNAKQYVEGVHKFIGNPPTGTLYKQRSNGDIVIYEPKTNRFAVADKNGTPKTMYKPAPKSANNPRGYDTSKYSSPLEYFNAQ